MTAVVLVVGMPVDLIDALIRQGASDVAFHAHLHLLGGRSFGWPPC